MYVDVAAFLSSTYLAVLRFASSAPVGHRRWRSALIRLDDRDERASPSNGIARNHGCELLMLSGRRKGRGEGCAAVSLACNDRLALGSAKQGFHRTATYTREQY